MVRLRSQAAHGDGSRYRQRDAGFNSVAVLTAGTIALAPATVVASTRCRSKKHVRQVRTRWPTGSSPR